MLRITPALAVAIACATPPRRPPPPARPTAPPAYVLLEPVSAQPGELPVVRPLGHAHPQRAAIERALARPYLAWILALGEQVKQRGRARCAGDAACKRRFEQPAYFVIVPGGNRPKQGFTLVDGDARRALPDAWYVEIDADDVATLIPHEYGHVMMFASLPGDLPDKPQTLPHTTGAITNDVVAFSEGWGIHFETLAGDRREETETHAARHRDTFAIDGPPAKGDSMLAVTDLFTYAQSYRRYTCVKENCFAYLPRIAESYVRDRRPTPADVLARWTDTTYDPARVRTLAQMVASEGVIATLFYRLATAPNGDALPDPARYVAFFDAFARITEERATTTPVVLVFLEALLEAAPPAERRRIARVALEVLHYTPSVADAPRLYAELHAAGHRLDKPAFEQQLAAAGAAFERAVERLVARPSAIREAVAPELWIVNTTMQLELPILGLHERPLAFDLNAAPVELLMTIPGVTYADAIAIDEARRRRPLRAVDELPLRADVVDAIRAMARAAQR